MRRAQPERRTGSTRSYDDVAGLPNSPSARGEILMSASTAAMASSTSVYTTRGFWERLWRLSGINFVVFAIIAYVIYGYPPPVGASADALVAFYDGHRTRILIAAVVSGLAVLNLLWFAAALRVTLADAGQDGWGAAATASSTAVGALFLLLLAVGAALAYSIAGSGNQTLTAGLNDFVWALVVLSSFPRAMLVMAGAFGVRRGGRVYQRRVWGGGGKAAWPVRGRGSRVGAGGSGRGAEC